jgi:5-methylcytosine-specific restriction protein A
MPKITLLRDVRRPKREHEHHTPIQLNNRSKFWQTYYQSPIWKTTRLTYKIEHPICERCLSQGIVTPMTDVHHKAPYGLGKTAEERWTLLSDKDNLVSLCDKCHHEVHTNKDRDYLWTLHDYYVYKNSIHDGKNV